MLPILTAALLAVPIALPPVLNYDTTLSFLLAPAVAWAIIASRREWTARAFVIAGCCGLASILIAAWIKPDGRLHLDVLSLVLLMFSAGFYFLGRHVGQAQQLIRWLAVFSALFLIPVTVRLLVTGLPVRGVTPDVLLFLDFRFFGLPAFASLGVNALAHLVCIQAALLCGALLNGVGRTETTAFGVALGCAVLLIVGSQSRSAAIFLALFIAFLPVYVLRTRPGRWRAIVAMLAIAIGVGAAAARGELFGARLAETAEAAIVASSGENAVDMDEVSSLRLTHLRLAAKEIAASPFIGSGFSPWGRYEPVEPALQKRLSKTSHVYYLTVLWKGGLLFAVPFYAFLGMAAWAAWRSGLWRKSPEAAMAVVAVILIFGPVSFTYDTPNVPSAGALAFLLLGALGRPQQVG